MLDQALPTHAARLRDRLAARAATVGVIGLGYVGLPLVRALARAGFPTLGFDIDTAKVEALNAGRSYLKQYPDAAIAEILGAGFEATADFGRIGEADALLICVPTPLNRYREPDLSYVTGTVEAIAPRLRPGQIIVLESTTYPGTTDQVLRPLIEARGHKVGEEVFLAYSPEREDPGNADFSTRSIPKVVGGDGAAAVELVQTLYRGFVERVVPVSSSATAEAVKLTENIFRAVNIALVNELKVIYAKMGVDVWEVIDAAATKPFGFMPFYPGPGLGGHCIPIDPFYLTWKAREYGMHTRFIELAGEINAGMPDYVLGRLAEALDARQRRGLNGSSILVVGVAYKKNVDDMRESPALVLIERLEARGANVSYHDPFLPVIPATREHAALAGRRSVEPTPQALAEADAVLIVTDHTDVDYAAVVEHARLVVDTRNATCDLPQDKVVRA